MAVYSTSELTFTILVGEYYLAQRTRGLLLSAAELELIREWEATGAPAAVVCEGIRLAFESWRQQQAARATRASKPSPGRAPAPAPADRPLRPPRPPTLRYCRRAVERALHAWQSGRVGKE